MTQEEARQWIEAAIGQFGPHTGMAIDPVIKEMRGDLGREAANALIEEFALELPYNIAPIEPLGSGD